MKKFYFFSVLAAFIFCYLCWMLFTVSHATQEMAAGAVISLVVAMFSARFLIQEKPLYFLKPQRFLSLAHYCFFVFIKELWRANVATAKRAFNTKSVINPGIVRVPTELKSEYGLAILANSITLRPGTITMEIVEENNKNYFYIHWIDVSVTRSKEAGEVIKGSLEKKIRRFLK